MRSPLALVALPLALALAGCSKDAAPAPAAPGGSTAAATPAAATPGDPLEGKPAPDVEMEIEDGSKVKLSSFRGKSVVLFFYPKDETPGCTVEAQGMRDQHEELTKAGITVFGVSTQDATSHKSFIAKEKLPFHLVVDAKETVAKAFGVSVTMGFASRDTIVVGPDGTVKKVFRKVTPKGHADEVLRAAKT